MAITIYPNGACLAVMDLIVAGAAPGKLHLVKEPFSPGPNTTLAELTAIECDFGGYAAGGEAVAAFLASYLDPLGGASAQIATIQWDATGVAPENLVYGWYYTSTGPPIVLFAVGTFDDPVPMGELGNSLPLDVKFNFGAGQ